MKNIRKAFTLSELLVTMTIIGIIMSVALSTYKKHDINSRYLYSNVYHSLDQAIYNAMNYTNLGNPFLDKDEQTRETLSSNEQVIRLCQMLTRYIKTTSSPAACSSIDPIDSAATDTEFQKTPLFTTINGIRFWSSNRLPETLEDPDDHYFFIVFADLNSTKAPNSMLYQRGVRTPDIFAFAVLDIGRVCPIGPPEIDENFLLSRVSFKLFPLKSADEAEIHFSSPSKPYFVTKAQAWGYYLPAERLDGAALENGFYIDDNPYTYNEYIRGLLPSNSMIYSGMPENLSNAITTYEGETSETVRVMSGSVDSKDYHCVKGFDDVCDLIIDKYSHS